MKLTLDYTECPLCNPDTGIRFAVCCGDIIKIQNFYIDEICDNMNEFACININNFTKEILILFRSFNLNWKNSLYYIVQNYIQSRNEEEKIYILSIISMMLCLGAPVNVETCVLSSANNKLFKMIIKYVL
jgi:hypothetical protein